MSCNVYFLPPLDFLLYGTSALHRGCGLSSVDLANVCSAHSSPAQSPLLKPKMSTMLVVAALF